MKKLFLLILLFCVSACGQVVTSVTGTGCSKPIGVAGQGTVGMSITGSWSGTIQPEVAVVDDPPQNTTVYPYGSTTSQATITANGVYQSSSVAGASVFVLCGNTVTGTATVKMTATTQSAASRSAGGGSGTVNSGTANHIAFYPASSATVGSDASFDDSATTANTLSYTKSGGITATAGPITSNTDGVHAGIFSLAGNTTVPTGLPTNSFGWLGPNSAAFTSYFLQPNSTAPAAIGPMFVGVTASNVSAVSYGTVTGNTTKVATSSGAITSGHCASWDVNSNITDSGGACGGVGTNINTFTSQVNAGSNIGMGTVGHTNCGAQWLPAPGVFNNVGIDVTTLDATNNYEFGIYTGAAGGTATLQCHTTAATLPTTGFKAIALSAACTLSAGRVYLCFGQAAGGATATIAEGAGIDVLLTQQDVSTSFFPATFTAPADSAAASQINHVTGAFKGMIFDLLP